MTGRGKGKNPRLRILFDRITEMITFFDRVVFEKVPRKTNFRALALAREAIDEHRREAY